MDVLVAGAGVIGLSVAWRAAQLGMAVTVVDDAPGSGASYAAAGMLAPVAEAAFGEEPLVALSRASLALYPGYVAELEQLSGRDLGLRTAGTLLVGFDEDDLRALEHVHAFHLELGLDAERLLPRACRAREPSLTPRLRGGVHVPGDHSVDARVLHAALLDAVRHVGVTLVPRRVSGLAVHDERVTGVRLQGGGEVPGSQVVLATGPWSGEIAGLPAGSVPVRPVKGQILRLRGTPLLDGTVRALVRGRAVYLVPYGGDRLVVGASVEELGFDPRVTAGAVLDLLRDATEVVPGLTELELVETTTRWRPGTPDNGPLLGAGRLPGLVLATGHYRNGVLLAPVTAEAVVAVLQGADPAPEAAAFTPNRFTPNRFTRTSRGTVPA